MAKNQAKVTFNAETEDFREDVKKAASSITALNSELKLNAEQMETSGESAELLSKRQEILNKKLEEAKKKTQNLEAQMESAVRNFGENSYEVDKLTTQINNAKVAEQKIAREISKVSDKLEKQAEETKDTRTESDKLEDSISVLNSELDLNAEQMKTSGESAELLTERQELLNKKLVEAKKKTKNLEAQMESAIKDYGENSVEAQKLATQINNARIAEQKIEREISGVNEKLEKQAEEARDTRTALEKLEDSISDQEKKLDKLKRAYANVVVEQGANSKEAKALAKEIRGLSDDLKDNKTKVSAAEKATDKLTNATEDAGDAAEDANDGFTVWKGTLADLSSSAIQGVLSGITDLAGALWGLSEETREFRTNMGKVETAFADAGYSAETAGSTYEDFYALLGDEGQATEAVNLLARLAKNEDQLAEYTRAATGIYAAFGDSIPIEGLIEAANETAKTGAVTGSLADALNWSTMSSEEWTEAFNGHPRALKRFQNAMKRGMTVEEAFNEALTQCTTESEREQVIRQALNGIYGEAADAYAETNGQIMAANRAQAKYNTALAGLGNKIEPLTTAWTNGMASILEAFGEMLSEVDMNALVGSLEDGFDWVINTAFPAIKTGIEWFIANKRAVITGITSIGAALAGIKVFNFAKSLGGIFGIFGGGDGDESAGGSGGKSGKSGGLNIKSVATTMAGIAIAIGGIGAIVVAFGALSQIPGFNDLVADGGGTLKQLFGIIEDIGLIGGAFVVAAGLIGHIPITALTAGMANIAIAIGGFAAIVSAFGALALIDGFNDFLKSGGEVLTTLCNILGQMVGAVIGGFGEGLTKSLPIIGENLSAFAANLEPMFASFSGVDTEGLQNFALALAALIAVIAGEKIVGVITGGINYGELGTNLSTMASSLSGFFTTIMTFPEGGFEKATALFDCLANISGLPKEGGVVGWFEGEVDYEKMAAGLGQLAGSVGFFTTVEGISEAAFTNASKLFEVLAGVKGLPKDDGIAQWFTGSIDYTKLADGLTKLTGSMSFFTAVENIPEAAFTNTTRLFEVLAGVKALPKDDGLVQWFTGTIDYGKLAEGMLLLSSEAMIAGYTAISKIPAAAFSNITALFATLAGVKALPKDEGLVQWFAGTIDYDGLASGLQLLTSAEMVAAYTAISKIPATAYSGITSLFEVLGGVKDLPESGGLFQWFTGDSTKGLNSVASQLPGVASNISTFYDNLGGVTDFAMITALFDTLGAIKVDSDAATKGWFGSDSKLETVGKGLGTFATKSASFFTMIADINLENLQGFFDTLSGFSGLPKALSTINKDVGTQLGAMEKTVETSMEAIRDEINIDDSKTDISTVLKSISSDMKTKLNSAFTTVDGIFEDIADGIEDRMDDAKKAVSDAIKAIKSKFDFTWKLPDLKLPHIKISGEFSIDPPKVPKFSIDWYAKGGILTRPTIFGAMGNRLMGGGEAGQEAVAPIDVLLGYVRDAVYDVIGGMTFAIDNDDTRYVHMLETVVNANTNSMARLIGAIEDLANRPIDLDIDGVRFATATAGASDSVSGTRLNLRKRGLAL